MMSKQLRILAVGAVCLGFYLTRAEAQFLPNPNDPDRVESIVGTIEGRHRNSIDVFDELEKRTKRFVYLNDRNELKIGDRIRVYYYPRGYLVQNIKKMTAVAPEEGKNQGYLFKRRNSSPAKK